jgi:hypothetical protein
MNHSKYNSKFDPKNKPNSPKTDVTTVAPVASVDVPKTPAAAPAASPAPIAAPVQAATTPTEKAGQAMVNEGGNSVVIDADAPRAVREPSALTGDLPEVPAVRSNGAAGPQTPALQAKPAEGVTS